MLMKNWLLPVLVSGTKKRSMKINVSRSKNKIGENEWAGPPSQDKLSHHSGSSGHNRSFLSLAPPPPLPLDHGDPPLALSPGPGLIAPTPLLVYRFTLSPIKSAEDFLWYFGCGALVSRRIGQTHSS